MITKLNEYKQYIIESNNTQYILCVDIQPEYEKFITFDLDDFIEYLNTTQHKIIFLYNGYDTLGMIKESEYISWLFELGLNEDVIDNSTFYDKGYAFFRSCIDYNIDEDHIIDYINFLKQNNINTNDDMDDNMWNDFIEQYGHEELKDVVEENGFFIPDVFDFIDNYNNIELIGGSKTECLLEIDIILRTLNKTYIKNYDFIF